MTACITFVFYSLETGAGTFVEYWQMSLFGISVIVPPILSCVNPIVFIILTPKLAGWTKISGKPPPSSDSRELVRGSLRGTELVRGSLRGTELVRGSVVRPSIRLSITQATRIRITSQ